MKVIEFIKRLEEIGYDENTELTFSCCDGETGEFYKLDLYTDEDSDGFCYGKDLYGHLYDKDEINIEIDVDGCNDYVESKQYEANEVLDRIAMIIANYNSMYSEVSDEM